MSLAAGTRLGPYEIASPLGVGGMGEVYRARDTRLGRDVAIKVLPPHLADSADSRARFEREAKAISSLNHPHICTLFDVGREGETDYLVMELVEGETLQKRLERGPLPTDEVLKLGMQIADALDKAHRQNMVHRDLKPANVMLTRTGAKLLDFGLARATGLAGNVSELTSSPTMTRALTTEGTIVGTFQYMSPEQLEGQEADARSDIWALGVTLYEAVTGKRAFEGRSQASLIGSIMNTEPSPVTSVATLAPPTLERLIRGCMTKDPDERIQTAHDVKLQLQWIQEGGSQAGIPLPVAARRRSRERVLVIATVVSALATAVLAAKMMLTQEPESPVYRFEIPPPSGIRFMDAPRISPDGRMIAYNATDSVGVSRIYLRPLDALVARPLGGTEGTLRPFWSPDSRFLGFMAGGKLKKVEVTGAPPIVVCDAPTGADGSWGVKGDILFDGRADDPIRQVSSGGGVPVLAVGRDTVKNVTQVGWPEFLPDGRHYLFLAIGANSRLAVGELGSTKIVDLGPCDSQIKFVPPGHILFSRGGTLVAQRFDAGSLKFRGDPVPIAEKVSTDAIGTSEFHASDNGILVFSTRRAQRGRLVRLDREGRELGVVNAPASGFHPALSPDGRRLVFRAVDDVSRSRDLWLVDLVRDVATRFSHDVGNENYPVWSPDGRKVIYYSDGVGSAGLYRKDVTGAGKSEMIYPFSTSECIPTCWSADGRLLFFDRAGVEGRRDIYVLDLTRPGSEPTAFLDAPFDEWQSTLSPDGRYLAYTSFESGRNEVYVQSYPDRADKWQVSTHGGNEPTWSADGRQLYYLSAEQNMMSVSTGNGQGFEPGVAERLFAAVVLQADGPRVHYVVTPDGGTFYIVAPGSSQALPSTYVVVNWSKAFQQS
ncbi:MAG: protein kinase [Candidatus Eisenbacteria bacterium]|nr:protein kinase [Candidatus Eisenbacteria bacterium]